MVCLKNIAQIIHSLTRNNSSARIAGAPITLTPAHGRWNRSIGCIAHNRRSHGDGFLIPDSGTEDSGPEYDDTVDPEKAGQAKNKHKTAMCLNVQFGEMNSLKNIAQFI